MKKKDSPMKSILKEKVSEGKRGKNSKVRNGP